MLLLASTTTTFTSKFRTSLEITNVSLRERTVNASNLITLSLV